MSGVGARPGRPNPMLSVVHGDGSGHEGEKDHSPSPINEIVREGARRMLAEALLAEVEVYIAAHAAERDDNGRCPAIRNGYHEPREVLTSVGAVKVTVPRVNDKRTDPAVAKITGDADQFSRSTTTPPSTWVHLRTTRSSPPSRLSGTGPRARLAGCGPGHGVQTHRVGSGPLALRERPSPRCPGPCWRPF